MAKEKLIKVCFTWMSWVHCLLSWQPQFSKLWGLSFLLGLAFFFTVFCVCFLCWSPSGGSFSILFVSVYLLIFLPLVFSVTPGWCSVDLSLFLLCNDSFSPTAVFYEPQLSLTASLVILPCLFLVHRIFWEAADSHTTARLQHLMYQVLNLWQIQSNIK